MRLPEIHWETKEALALMLLRLGCVWAVLVSAVNKVQAPARYAELAAAVDGIDLSDNQVFLLAGVQTLVCAAAAVGWRRPWSYAALALVQAGTLARHAGQIVDPFELSERGAPVNGPASVQLAVLAAMLALILSHQFDRWTVDGLAEWWRARRGGGAAAQAAE